MRLFYLFLLDPWSFSWKQRGRDSQGVLSKDLFSSKQLPRLILTMPLPQSRDSAATDTAPKDLVLHQLLRPRFSPSCGPRRWPHWHSSFSQPSLFPSVGKDTAWGSRTWLLGPSCLSSLVSLRHLALAVTGASPQCWGHHAVAHHLPPIYTARVQPHI